MRDKEENFQIIIAALVDYIVSNNIVEGLDLEILHTNPMEICRALENLGYELENADINGWDEDTLMRYTKDDSKLLLNYSGYYGNIGLGKSE